MKKILLTAALISLAVVPHADAKTKKATPKADDLNIVASQDLCGAYKQTEAQDAAYKPGVDVNGNAVAPADLPSTSAVKIPDIVEVPLTIDLAQRLNISVTGMEMKSTLGVMKVYKDGRVTYDDKDITTDAKSYCANGGTKPPINVPPADMGVVDIGPLPAAVPVDAAVEPAATNVAKPSTVAPSVTSSP